MSRRGALTVVAAVTLLLAIRLVRLDPARWSSDALYYAALATHPSDHPDGWMEPDYIGRRHPLFLLALAAVRALAGLSIPALTVLAYAGHLAAALLLGRVVARLGAAAAGADAAALLFALFPGANNLFADPIHFARTWNVALALAALLALLAGRGAAYVLLYATTLLNFEDAVLLPVAGLGLAWLRPRAVASKPVVASGAHAAAFALMALAIVVALRAPGPAHPLHPGAHVVTKAALLPVEVARSALMPRSDVLPPLAARLAVAGLAALLLCPRPAAWRLERRSALTLLLLAAAFAAPYVARPLAGGWQSRYLYAPAAPLLALAGALVAATPRARRLAGLALVGAIGVTTTERAADVIAARHLLRVDDPEHMVALIAAQLGRAPEPTALAPEDCVILRTVHVPVPPACQTP